MVWPLIRVLPLWIVAVSVATAARSQTVELKSLHLSVLTGGEREHFLAAHNTARREVGVDPVQWSDELGKEALASLAQQKDVLIEAAKESWAKRQAVLPRHRADSSYGENIAGWAGTGPRSADWAVDLWLLEKADFDKLNSLAPYRVGDEQEQFEVDREGNKRPIIVGHYTQIVWSATQQIGAAKLGFDLTDEQGNRRSYLAIICNYSPPGNRRGEKPF